MPARRTHSLLRTLGTAAACVMLAGNVFAGESDIYLGIGGGDYEIPKVQSMRDLRYKNVVHQRFDYSCGSAAVATLLTYHYSHPVKETDVLTAMYENGDKEKIRTQGFSLLDMKQYLEKIGYHAEGYKESLDKLAAVGIPAIVLINKHGYLHFVVVKGVTKDRVAVGDPTLGLRIYNRSDFEKMWNGIIFVILDQKSIGQASFNTAENWSLHGSPNFRNVLDNGQLGNLTISISMTPNYY